jgi:hypothetical protein
MKEKILLFLHSLTTYDYIFYISIFVIFVVLILLILLLRNKPSIALLLLLIAILEVSLGPTIGYSYFHNYLYKNSITLTKAKRLQFVQAVVIEGKLKNESKFDFTSCEVKAKIVKKTKNKYKNMILQFKPIKTKTITLQDIPKNTDVAFKFLIEPFTYKKDFNVTVSGVCR